MNRCFLLVTCGLISVVIIKEYLDIFLPQKDITNIVKYILYGFILLFAAVLEEGSQYPILNFIANYCFVLCISIILYKGYLKEKIIVSFSMLCIWAFSEIIIGYLIQLLCLEKNLYYGQQDFCSKLIMLFMVVMISSLFTYNHLGPLPFKYWCMVAIIPLSSIFIEFSIFSLSFNSHDRVKVVVSLVSSFLLLPLNFMIFKVYNRLTEEKEIMKQNAVFTRQLELCARQIKETEDMQNEIKHIRHDMKKCFFSLMSIAESQHYDEIGTYLKDFMEGVELHNNTNIINTGNLIIDSFINNIYATATTRGIECKIKVNIPNLIHIGEADLSIILGNALDNALEANERLNATDCRFIQIVLSYNNGKLSIGIRNSCDGIVRKDKSGRYMTIKKDKIYHGMGISSIEKIVEKYNGFVSFDMKNNVFTFLATLNEREA